MADVELVIKIDEKLYNDIYSDAEIMIYSGMRSGMRSGKTLLATLLRAIRNGTPLPKGHGRLIDADALSKDDDVTEWLSLNAVRTGKMLKRFSELFIKKINDAPTILEATEEVD